MFNFRSVFLWSPFTSWTWMQRLKFLNGYFVNVFDWKFIYINRIFRFYRVDDRADRYRVLQDKVNYDKKYCWIRWNPCKTLWFYWTWNLARTNTENFNENNYESTPSLSVYLEQIICLRSLNFNQNQTKTNII